jgi:hypothetical protein
MKNILIAAGLIVAVFCAVAVVAVLQNLAPAQKVVPLENKLKPVPAPQTAEATAPVEKAPAEKSVAPPEAVPQTPPVKAGNNANARSPQTVAANGIGDPLARDALSLVGADPSAEVYWIAAINNPNLASDERRELIEDLNQDGFADTKNLGADDLPLIVNRLQLIEELWPDAMDEVNAAAFQEAYKDLLNMYGHLTLN